MHWRVWVIEACDAESFFARRPNFVTSHIHTFTNQFNSTPAAWDVTIKLFSCRISKIPDILLSGFFFTAFCWAWCDLVLERLLSFRHLTHYITYPGAKNIAATMMGRFLTERPVEQHWLNSPSHAWCRRCDMLFKTEQDLETHRENSMNHWLCHKCSLDHCSQEDLYDHYSDAEHNWCYECERDFDTPSNLHQVWFNDSIASGPWILTVKILSTNLPICLGTSHAFRVEVTAGSQHTRPCLSTWKTAAARPWRKWTG